MALQPLTIGICTGGGDCPGLNAVIRAAVNCAIMKYGWNVLGIEDGFDGLLWPEEKLRVLSLNDVIGILPRGGTILGTTNRGDPFKYKFVENGVAMVRDVSDDVIRNAKELGMDALIVIGGEGTLKIALELYRKGLNVVGVPKTIDNDISSTDVTFGFDTALHTATDAIDKIHTTAESHHRVMLVEVMGRDVGWIALEAGIAGAAQVILIPEIPFDIRKICEVVRKRDEEGKRFTIIVVAEGIEIPDYLRAKFAEERRKQPRSGVAATLIGEAVASASSREVRVTVLGHIQRGGSPSPLDRILSTRFGGAAVELIATRNFGKMVCLRGGVIRSTDIAEAVGTLKAVDPQGELVQMARSIGISFGD
jgi:ATP-dependent phosphofructokinase / diphosphate-dependent phosphofructokinase